MSPSCSAGSSSSSVSCTLSNTSSGNFFTSAAKPSANKVDPWQTTKAHAARSAMLWSHRMRLQSGALNSARHQPLAVLQRSEKQLRCKYPGRRWPLRMRWNWFSSKIWFCFHASAIVNHIGLFCLPQLQDKLLLGQNRSFRTTCRVNAWKSTQQKNQAFF